MYGVTKLDTMTDIALVSFKKIPLSMGLMAEIFDTYAQNGINIDMIAQTAPTSNRVSISFTCHDSDIIKVLEITNALSKAHHELVPMVSSGNCKIQLYGEEMRSTYGVFARALRCLSQTNVEVQQITTSEVDISILVSSAHVEIAIDALASAFQL